MNATYSDYADWRVANERESAELWADELGNCPNCAEIVCRETYVFGTRTQYYWPCPTCGFTWHGEHTPDLD